MALKKKKNNLVPLERIPPQNLEAEECVLGSILIEESSINKVLEIIQVSDFYKDAHQKVFRSMIELFEKGEAIDIITVTDCLKKMGCLEEVGGPLFVASLCEKVPTASNVTYYAKIVKEKAILRKLLEASTDIASQVYEREGDAEEFLDYAERRIFEISQYRIRPSWFHLKDILKDTFRTIEKLYSRKELVTGISTGFIELDRLTSGLQPSDFIIIAARPSMGKTSLALDIAQHAAIDLGIPIGFFSLEMSKEQLTLRMLCARSRVEMHRLRSGYLIDSDWPKLTRAAGILTEAPFIIDDSPSLSVLELRAKARRLKSEMNLGLLVVDYLQLMKGSSKADTREQEISEISRSLKSLSKELNIPVIALSQLSRKVEQRHGNRPQLADLRESGAIEQDADLIMFIYRDEVYNPDTSEKGIAEIIIGKQRNGPTGTVKLAFLDKYTTFENLAPPGTISEIEED